MHPEFDDNEIGKQLGTDGVNNLVSKGEQFCAFAQQHIALRNHPEIVALSAEFALLRKEAAELDEELCHAPPVGDPEHRRKKAIWSWTTFIVLTGAGFFFALLAFDPFRLGWKSYVYCLGIAVVVPFLVEKLLDDNRLTWLVKVLTGLAATTGIASLMLLAVIRGNLLSHEIETPPVLVVDGAQGQPDTATNFYTSSFGLLELATVLLSFTMELGAGIALREGWRLLPEGTGQWRELRDERRQVSRRMVVLAAELTRLQDEPQLFVAKFWRDFLGSMLAHTLRSAMSKFVVLFLAALLIPQAHATGKPRLDLVIALDLSRSVAVKGPDGRTEFQNDVDGVTRILGEVPPGTRLTVIGITDRSFTQPYVLLSASVPDDPGYFGERLIAVRKEIVRVWKQRSANLAPSFPGTDIIGAIELAGELFHQRPTGKERQLLVLLSDMQNHTRQFDLDRLNATRDRAPTVPLLAKASLRDVEVDVLGVESARPSPEAWERLRRYWVALVQYSGARLDMFSVLTELPASRLER